MSDTDQEKPPTDWPTFNVLGVDVAALSTTGLLDAVDVCIDRAVAVTVVSGNVHSLNLACGHPWLRDFMNAAGIVRLDGAGVGLAGRILGHAPPPRSTWADFGWALAERCALKGHRLFLFGGEDGVAARAGDAMKERSPALTIVGAHHGYIPLMQGDPAEEQLITTIADAMPDIVVVGLGMPLQEAWLARRREDIAAPVVMTSGAAFSYLAGDTRRAPEWMLRSGLEWCFRFCQEPGRMWRRYVVGNPVFMCRVLAQRLAGKGRA